MKWLVFTASNFSLVTSSKFLLTYAFFSVFKESVEKQRPVHDEYILLSHEAYYIVFSTGVKSDQKNNRNLKKLNDICYLTSIYPVLSEVMADIKIRQNQPGAIYVFEIE